MLDKAIPQPELLARVVKFKEKFYRTPWAKLPDTRPGTIKLVPPACRMGELEADYTSMRPMLFGRYPAFGEIIGCMAELVYYAQN